MTHIHMHNTQYSLTITVFILVPFFVLDHSCVYSATQRAISTLASCVLAECHYPSSCYATLI
ncbi:hypothetical protein BDN67DRAFT_974180 [Paxillus ammoniavirescens]|nr:hypothetical protein BDN67DRAFT_974180 [Paxillus ammoniavirescens]